MYLKRKIKSKNKNKKKNKKKIKSVNKNNFMHDALCTNVSKGAKHFSKRGVPNIIDSKNRDLGTSGKLIIKI